MSPRKWIEREIARLEVRTANDKIIGLVPGFIMEWTMLIGAFVLILFGRRPEGALILMVGNVILSTVRRIERDRRLKAAGLEGTEE